MTRQEAFRRRYNALRSSIDERLRKYRRRKAPAEVRDATSYVIEGGGKRVRGVIVMLSCQVLGKSPLRAIDAAAAVEILHNFTLVHDDIMDSALERRGRPSVHQKWGVNTALLLGDVLVGEAYASLLRASGKRTAEVLGAFTEALQEVCDGQALDMELERRTDVRVSEYFPMIDKKTGALLSCAALLGGLIAGGTRLQTSALGRFGRLIGRAFQLQDDLLDVVADPRNFGKAIGGDIIEGKKTFLLLTAAERARGENREVLERVLARPRSSQWKREDGTLTEEGAQVIEDIRRVYEQCGVLRDAQQLVRRTTGIALRQLNRLPSSSTRDMLSWLGESLVHRIS